VVSFLVSSDDAKKISHEFILDNDPEHKHMSPAKLVTQDVGMAYIKMGNYAFQAKTFLEERTPDWDIKKAIIEGSRREDNPQPTNSKASSDEIPNDPFTELNPEDLF